MAWYRISCHDGRKSLIMETPSGFENAPKNTHKKVLELLRSAESSGPVMDIPCGDGSFARQVAEQGNRVIAIDIVQHENEDGIDFRQADINKPLPFADGMIECIACIEGIEHLERPFDFVRECNRIMSDGGRLILTTPNISSLRSRWRWFLTGFHNKCKYMLDEAAPTWLHHINMLSFPALRYMLHTNGFEIEKIDTNQIKTINWIYLPLAPLQYLVTFGVNRKAKPHDINRDLSDSVLKQMMTLPVLLGESMIIVARKISSPGN